MTARADAPAWECPKCGQVNAGWAKTCGRCQDDAAPPPKPAPAADLVRRLRGYNPPDRTVPEQRQMAQDIADAAAAIEAAAKETADAWRITDHWRKRAERAEDERDALAAKLAAIDDICDTAGIRGDYLYLIGQIAALAAQAAGAQEQG